MSLSSTVINANEFGSDYKYLDLQVTSNVTQNVILMYIHIFMFMCIFLF